MGFAVRDVLDLPAVYRAWQAPFVAQKLAPVLMHNDVRAVRRVLDVGCGPGTNASRFSTVPYIGVDLSRQYVADARRRTGRPAAAADARHLPVPSGRFDFILVNSMLHHVDTPGVHAILQELARVSSADGHVHVLELVLPESASVARTLANLDRGKYARPLAEWRDLFTRYFDTVVFEPYNVSVARIPCWSMVYFKGRARETVNQAPRVSAAIAVYNEEANVPELVRRLSTVFDALPGGPHEMVFVDDGSTDGTVALLEAAARRDPRIVLVSLSRNFGHQAALTAALDHVSGDVTVVMDGDLQDPPEAIPLFLERAREGYDVVYGRRVGRKEPWWLRAAYYTFYRMLASIADLRLPLDAGDFSLLSSRVVAEVRRTREYHRYLRGLRTWVGFRQTGVDLERPFRHAGRSKYNLSKLFALGLNGIFAFSIVPLRLAALLGVVAVMLSGGFGVYSIYAKIVLNRSPQGFAALMVMIVFLSGVNLIFLGVIGEYVGRVYEQVKARPVYVVASVTGRAQGPGPTPGPR